MDLTPTLTQGKPSPRNELPYYRQGTLRAYRQGQYKTHFYPTADSAEPLPTPELYNLHRDPAEKQNLAAQEPETLAALQAATARGSQ